MKDYLVTTIALLLLIFGASLIIDIEDLLYPPAIQQVIAPLLIITLVFRVFTNVQVPKLWFWAGIPLGITSSAICLLSLLYNMASADGFEQQIAYSLISLGYGLAASMLGRTFIGHKSSDAADSKEDVPTALKLFVGGAVLACFLISTQSLIGLSGLLDPSAGLIVFSVLLLGTYKSRAGARAEGVMSGFVFGSLACVFVGLVGYLFSGLDPRGLGPATATGLLGIIYSGLGVVGATIFFQTKELKQSSVERKNWHLMEIYALWVLMCFAPMSLRESFSFVN